MKLYDVIIVGGGTGGYSAAIKCAQGKLRTAVIDERPSLGGVCLNEGCIPTKAMVQSVQAYRTAKNGEQWGFNVDGTIQADLKSIIARKNAVVEQLTSGVRHLMDANGVEVIQGKARLTSENKVEVNNKQYHAGQIILATGAVPKKPSIEGIDQPHVMTSTEILNSEELPEEMVVIGSGAIGVEFAAIMNGLGVKVTVVEALPNILPYSDVELAGFYKQHLEASGIKFYLNSKVEKIEKNKVVIISNGEKLDIKCSRVLVAVGREINRSVFDEKWEKELVKDGVVETDEQMKTKVNSISAIGDINGRYWLAHVATAEGLVAAANLAGKESAMDYRFIPQCVYSDLELAGVGLTEEAAKKENVSHKVAGFPITSNGKAVCDGVPGGMIKLITGTTYDDILGVHVLAPHASELIAESVMALHMEMTADELVKIIHPHPSLSEIYPEVAFSALGVGLHS